MRRFILWFALVSILSATVGGVAGCDSKPVAPTLICLTDVAITIAIAATEDTVNPSTAIEVIGACYEAATEIIASVNSPSTPSQKVNIYKGQALKAKLTAQISIISNCTSASALKSNYTWEGELQQFIRVGTHTYTSRPPTGDDPEATIADGLIDEAHVPIGSYLTSYVNFALNIPAHQKAIVSLAGSAMNIAGTADIEQDSKVLTPLVSYLYPTQYHFDDSATKISYSSCA
ncbi:MAG TPA: hypothetical protein VF725_12890 [Ktedonobacterales bacterium]